jgi:hypothetical protein
MTLIGFWLVNDERALVWADTEHYLRNGAPNGEHNLKLAINRLTGVVGTHAGDTFGYQLLADAITAGPGIDILISKLRPAVCSFADNGPQEWTQKWTFCVAGWSTGTGKMHGIRLRADDDFRGEWLHHFAAPHVRGFETLNPREPEGLLTFARAQMREIQKQVPLAGDGSLTVADIRPRRVDLIRFDSFFRPPPSFA